MDNSSNIRLNKFISESGICSRREADRYIESGRVLINKRKAVIGDIVKPGDMVTVNGQQLEPRKGEELIFIALNKPIDCTTLQPGQTWNQFGFLKCITTSSKQKEYIERVMRQISFDIIDPLIGEEFTPKSTPAMPIIGVHSKDQSDAINLIKTFYLKFPQYRWFTFRDLRGLSEKEFANSLRDCFLSVWIDDHSAFGTFPLESMKSNVPVIGKVPNLSPDWMSEENGIWVTDQTLLPDLVADYAQNWLEDNIDPQIFEKMKETVERYTDKQKFESSIVSLFDGYLSNRADAFENQISKTEE
jgi:hypothetical protein